MHDKAKRKHKSHRMFGLKFLLILFILGTWATTLKPMIWLAPPLFQFTPFVYIGLSLLWIPIVWRARHFVKWDKVILVLIAGCIVSTHFMSFVFYERVSLSSLRCSYVDIESTDTVYRCITIEYICPHMRFDATPAGNFLITQGLHWWHGTGCLAYSYLVKSTPLFFLCIVGIYFVKKCRLEKLV